jgi:hypothetical protein
MPATIKVDLPPPQSTAAADVADWVEGSMLLEGLARMSKAAIRDRIHGSGFGDDPEAIVEFALAEVSRRQGIAPRVYPFQESDSAVVLNATVDPFLYECLLWMSISPAYRRLKQFARADYLFDHIVRAAIAGWLGPSSISVRFAWPSLDGRPKAFPLAMEWLAALMGLRLNALRKRPVVKDGGVDIVAWRPFLDRRTGFIVVLCQATLESNWDRKARDIVIDKWRGWISLGKDPVTALAVPFAVSIATEEWEELATIVHVVLDRFRLCELSTVALPGDIRAKLVEWTAIEHQRLIPPAR